MTSFATSIYKYMKVHFINSHLQVKSSHNYAQLLKQIGSYSETEMKLPEITNWKRITLWRLNWKWQMNGIKRTILLSGWIQSVVHYLFLSISLYLGLSALCHTLKPLLYS